MDDSLARRRLRRRSVRGLLIQGVGAGILLAVACVFAANGNYAGAVVFAFLTLVPVGSSAVWAYAYRRAGGPAERP